MVTIYVHIDLFDVCLQRFASISKLVFLRLQFPQSQLQLIDLRLHINFDDVRLFFFQRTNFSLQIMNHFLSLVLSMLRLLDLILFAANAVASSLKLFIQIPQLRAKRSHAIRLKNHKIYVLKKSSTHAHSLLYLLYQPILAYPAEAACRPLQNTIKNVLNIRE